MMKRVQCVCCSLVIILLNCFLYSNIYMMLQELPFVHFMKKVIKQVFCKIYSVSEKSFIKVDIKITSFARFYLTYD